MNKKIALGLVVVAIALLKIGIANKEVRCSIGLQSESCLSSTSFNIPTTGSEASEVGADYTKLANLLTKQRLKAADKQNETQDLGRVKAALANGTKVHQNTNPPTFEDYPVDTVPFTGNHSPIDFDSHPDAYTFRDALNYGIQYGPNFAQNYTIVSWGCGTNCQAFAIVDAYTGAVYFPKIFSSVGLAFRIDSNLLIVDPPENIQSTYVPPGVGTQYFIWKDKQLLPIK